MKINGSFHFMKDNTGNLTGWFLHNHSISPAVTTAILNTPISSNYIGTYSAQWNDGVQPLSTGILEISLKSNSTNIYELKWKSNNGKNKIFNGEGMLNTQQNILVGWYEN